MIVTHAYSMNGNGWTELEDSFGPPSEELCRLLHRLDGKDRFSFILWALPEGRALDEVSLETDTEQYIQAAGSAERMTVEVRRVTGRGAEQLVVGRSSLGEPEPDQEVRWDDFTNVVRENEVFGADEACTIFVAYYETGAVPGGHALRRLDLG